MPEVPFAGCGIDLIDEGRRKNIAEELGVAAARCGYRVLAGGSNTGLLTALCGGKNGSREVG